jgi:hypothetical protein
MDKARLIARTRRRRNRLLACIGIAAVGFVGFIGIMFISTVSPVLGLLREIPFGLDVQVVIVISQIPLGISLVWIIKIQRRAAH